MLARPRHSEYVLLGTFGTGPPRVKERRRGSLDDGAGEPYIPLAKLDADDCLTCRSNSLSSLATEFGEV